MLLPQVNRSGLCIAAASLYTRDISINSPIAPFDPDNLVRGILLKKLLET